MVVYGPSREEDRHQFEARGRTNGVRTLSNVTPQIFYLIVGPDCHLFFLLSCLSSLPKPPSSRSSPPNRAEQTHHRSPSISFLRPPCLDSSCEHFPQTFLHLPQTPAEIIPDRINRNRPSPDRPPLESLKLHPFASIRFSGPSLPKSTPKMGSW